MDAPPNAKPQRAAPSPEIPAAPYAKPQRTAPAPEVPAVPYAKPPYAAPTPEVPEFPYAKPPPMHPVYVRAELAHRPRMPEDVPPRGKRANLHIPDARFGTIDYKDKK